MHKMKVKHIYYTKLKNGTKTIELRLYDEKRQKIKPGDEIEFCNAENAEVIALYRARNFIELSEKIDIKKAGFLGTPEELQQTMTEFYPITEQQKFGVLGIEVKRKRQKKKTTEVVF